MFWWPYLVIVSPLKHGGKKAWEKARSKYSVYVISSSEKFQTHSTHSLIKPRREVEPLMQVQPREHGRPWFRLQVGRKIHILMCHSFFLHQAGCHIWCGDNWIFPLISLMLHWGVILIFETFAIFFMICLPLAKCIKFLLSLKWSRPSKKSAAPQLVPALSVQLTGSISSRHHFGLIFLMAIF